MSFDHIWGHERPIRVLRKALSVGRVPHAYLFWGPSGVGKGAVARAVGKVLLCRDPASTARGESCGACGSCRKVDAGSHPDLHVLSPEGASVSISEIRSLQETLSYQAFERGRKVAILSESFRMTREASNALLKTLEEPSAGIHIFLLAEHRDQLLPTLVSRCQSLRFDPLREDEVRRFLESRGVEPEIAKPAARISGGCPGVALGEDTKALLDLEREAAEVWGRWEGMTAADRFSLSSRWVSEKERLRLRLDCLERSVKRSVETAGLGGAIDRAGLAALGALLRTRRLIQQNVNAQLAVDALFLGIGEKGWEANL